MNLQQYWFFLNCPYLILVLHHPIGWHRQSYLLIFTCDYGKVFIYLIYIIYNFVRSQSFDIFNRSVLYESLFSGLHIYTNFLEDAIQFEKPVIILLLKHWLLGINLWDNLSRGRFSESSFLVYWYLLMKGCTGFCIKTTNVSKNKITYWV